jgi:hypothetical protein
MSIAANEQPDRTNFKVGDHDVKIMSGYVVLAIVLLIAIYAASASPGTDPGELASMSVFP